MNKKYEKTKIKIINTPSFGSVVIIWSIFDNQPKVIRILLSNPELSAEDKYHKFYSNSQESSNKKINYLSTMIKSFIEGEDVKYDLDILALETITPFQKSVLMATYNILRGSISNYQLIAQSLGKNKAYRAVANALARNPFPIIVPCHRVILSNGQLGGYQGGEYMKRSLLKMEGIKFNKNNQIINNFKSPILTKEKNNPSPSYNLLLKKNNY